MLVRELKEMLQIMPYDAHVLVKYVPELDLIDIKKVSLTGFDEYNAIVSLETNRPLIKEDTAHGKDN